MQQQLHQTPICLTIAGSDPSAGAGLQADLKTFHSLGVYGTTVITALTAQNTQQVSGVLSTPASFLQQQLQILTADLNISALKIGMLGDLESVEVLENFLNTFTGYKILDPVMVATSGDLLVEEETITAIKSKLLPHINLITPNLFEAEFLCGFKITTPTNLKNAAEVLLSYGVKAVLIKGGHNNQTPMAMDYYHDSEKQFYLNSPKIDTKNTHGTGCTLSAAICSFVALGYRIEDGITLAKAYINQGLRSALEDETFLIGKGCGPLKHLGMPNQFVDFPTLYFENQLENTTPFKPLKEIGIYPVVDSLDWVKFLLKQNVKTIQLRIKNPEERQLKQHLLEAITLCKQNNCTLFINDHWQLALELGAEAIHLGQSDLDTADIEAIQKANVYLGISTHTPSEVARALSLKPSYIAIGPVFATTTKQMPFIPQGINNLKYWVNLLKNNYPTVAIGGIFYDDNGQAVYETGVNGIAIVRDLTQSTQPKITIQNWQQLFQQKVHPAITKQFLPQLLPT